MGVLKAVIILFTVIGIPGSAAADDVARWLADRELDRLLAEHLEQQLPALQGDRRRETAIRLAKLYAALLIDVDDRSLRLSLEERGRRLLSEVTGEAARELRLELAHGTYLGIELAAERHRLRLLGPDDLRDVRKRVGELSRDLEQLAVLTAASLERAERAAPRRSQRGDERSRLAHLREMRTRIQFLRGWSQYYQGWLADDASMMGAALPFLRGVLGLDVLDLREVSVDLRSEPGIGWSIIGVAMVYSAQGKGSDALRWLDLLDVPQVPETIRSQLAGWRLAIHLEQADFESARSLLAATGGDAVERPLAWTRLSAVAALESAGEPGADELAAMALGDLARLGQADQIQDLVERYPEAGRTDGFPFQYARAVLAYRDALAGQNREDEDPVTRQLAWEESARAVEAALEAEDGTRFADTMIQAKLLLAWSRYYLGSYGEARELFIEAATALPKEPASEALWQAYLSEEQRLVAVSSDDRTMVDQLVNQYLDQYPDGRWAGELMVRRASSGETASLRRVEELLQVPLDSSSRGVAVAKASDMLYRLFREADPVSRPDLASQYLALAVPMMQRDDFEEDPVANARAVARARRILEIATHRDVQRSIAADAALVVLDNRANVVQDDDQELENEINYRRVLLELARGNLEDAQVLVDLLYERAPQSRWSRLAGRRVFDRDRAVAKSGQSNRATLQRIFQNGRQIIEESETVDQALALASGASLVAAVARAGAQLGLDHGDESAGRQAYLLYQHLLGQSPRNRAFLADRGRLASFLGDREEALRCWRIVTAGSRAGSDDWFEARTRLVELLAEADRSRAVEVLAQHRALYPDFGPAPWGPRLRGLAIHLGAVNAEPLPAEEDDGS